MASLPAPLKVILPLIAAAIIGSGLYQLVAPHPETLVLEPSDREEAVRLGTLDEAAEAALVAPSLPAVPRLSEGSTLAHGHGSGASAAEAGDDLSAEMRLLSEARSHLAEDPGAALTLLEQHRERYPHGVLREEREAYAILLLRRMARTEDAERRLVDFRMDFPTSSFDAVLLEHSAPGSNAAP